MGGLGKHDFGDWIKLDQFFQNRTPTSTTTVDLIKLQLIKARKKSIFTKLHPDLNKSKPCALFYSFPGQRKVLIAQG